MNPQSDGKTVSERSEVDAATLRVGILLLEVTVKGKSLKDGIHGTSELM